MCSANMLYAYLTITNFDRVITNVNLLFAKISTVIGYMVKSTTIGVIEWAKNS